MNQNFFNYWRLRHLHNRDIDDELRLQLMDRAERTCLTQIARVAMQVGAGLAGVYGLEEGRHGAMGSEEGTLIARAAMQVGPQRRVGLRAERA